MAKGGAEGGTDYLRGEHECSAEEHLAQDVGGDRGRASAAPRMSRAWGLRGGVSEVWWDSSLTSSVSGFVNFICVAVCDGSAPKLHSRWPA